jgi:hypothetical protein
MIILVLSVEKKTGRFGASIDGKLTFANMQTALENRRLIAAIYEPTAVSSFDIIMTHHWRIHDGINVRQ